MRDMAADGFEGHVLFADSMAYVPKLLAVLIGCHLQGEWLVDACLTNVLEQHAPSFENAGGTAIGTRRTWGNTTSLNMFRYIDKTRYARLLYTCCALTVNAGSGDRCFLPLQIDAHGFDSD